MTTLNNCTIYSEDAILENASITFDHTIKHIGKTNELGIDLLGAIVIPGFIDEHIHGLNGQDVMDASMDALKIIARNLPYEGTTAFLATTLTEDKETIIKALKRINLYMNTPDSFPKAELLGIHLEGPFISCEYHGAQAKENISEIDISLFDEFQKASGNHILHVTYAPEKDKTFDFTKHLVKNGIVPSIGHTSASYAEVKKAIDAGANCFTHGYNAMSKLHHRDIGAVGAMLLHNETYAEIIADKIHVSKEAIKLLYLNKTSDKLILMTDSTRAKNMPDGNYLLGSYEVSLKNNMVTLKDGTLAGSVLKMHDAVTNFKEITNASLKELIQMASVNPAKIHHLYDRIGSIRVGKDADLLVLNNNLEIISVYCKGQLIQK